MKIGNTSLWDISNRVPEIYGILLFLSLILYFFLCYLAGWIYIVELRMFNMAILITVVYFAMKQFRRTHGGHMDYFHAFTTGMATAAIGAVGFAAFVLVYLSIDKRLMEIIVAKQPLGIYLNPYIAAFIVFLEGCFSGLFVTFLMSNFLATRKPLSRMGDKSQVIQ